jgi:hypothetical protein
MGVGAAKWGMAVCGGHSHLDIDHCWALLGATAQLSVCQHHGILRSGKVGAKPLLYLQG